MKLRFAAALALLVTTAPASADTLIDNIQGISIARDGTVTRFDGMMVQDDGRIRQILKDGEEPNVPVQYHVDGQGRVVVPGMIDAHLHLMDIGFQALTLDLSDTTSLAEAQAKIAEYAAKYPMRPWIIGAGWNQEKWGLGRFPTAAELDSVVADRPVWLSRVDGHAGWANTKAMSMAGVTAKTADPAGGKIIRGAPATKTSLGAPTGVFIDGAQSLVSAKVPDPRPEDRDLAFLTAQDLLLKRGVTAVADMGIGIEDWQSYRRAGDNGNLRIRIMAYADGVDSMVLIGGPGPTPWLYDDRLKLEGIKLWLDGALGSRGAWLKAPYSDDPTNSGLQRLTSSQLRNIMSRAALDKFQVAVHAIGDAANVEVLDAIGEMTDTYGGDRRWRIEHAQIVDPADLPRFAEHGIIASMQPVHQTSDRLMTEARLGPARLAGAYAWKTMEDEKVPLAFGSDAPVELPDPFAGIAVAITREDENGQPFGGWQPQQVITREQALAAYTSGAAYAGFADGHFGQLVAGERADFLMLDRDPLLASPQDIRATKVLEVWINGQQVTGTTAPPPETYDLPEPDAPVFDSR